MRDLEFLPKWYPQLQRRRRLLVLQVWVSVLLAAGLGLWLFLADRNRCSAEQALVAVGGQWKETNTQLEQMARLEALQKQLRQQAEVLDRLGLHVKSSLLLEKLAAVIPPTVSLQSLEMSVDEVAGPPVSAANAGGKALGTAAVDRRLSVKVVGVSPTDVEVATFVIELNKVPFFDRVGLSYTRDRREEGHVMREFELTFSVNLNLPAGN